MRGVELSFAAADRHDGLGGTPALRAVVAYGGNTAGV